MVIYPSYYLSLCYSNVSSAIDISALAAQSHPSERIPECNSTSSNMDFDGTEYIINITLGGQSFKVLFDTHSFTLSMFHVFTPCHRLVLLIQL